MAALGLAYSIVVIVIAGGVLFAFFVVTLAARKRLTALELNNLKRDASLEYSKLPKAAYELIKADLDETLKCRRRIFKTHNMGGADVSLGEEMQMETSV